jgi:radical SAM protein with 4Fe4S-binding SPASM domain
MLKPKQVDIEVTSACNLKCRFCPGLGTKAQHMDVDLYKSIIDRIDFPTTVVPWLNGEPLLHPNYLELIKYTDEAGFRYYITTNGMIHNFELFDYISRKGSNCYQIIISLDGMPSSNSVELARPGTAVTKVLQTIAYLNSKSKYLDVAVKICRRGQDWEEIEKYISYWLDMGIDFVIVGDQLVEENNPEGFRRYPCQYSDNNFMVIKVDGRVVRCAYNTEATNNHDYTFDNVGNGRPLLEIYNNEWFTKFREDQAEGIFHGPCKTCGFPYTGQGFEGKIKLRDKSLSQKTIYYHRDYYNQFFSYKKKRKKKEYYEQGFSGEVKYK